MTYYSGHMMNRWLLEILRYHLQRVAFPPGWGGRWQQSGIASHSASRASSSHQSCSYTISTGVPPAILPATAPASPVLSPKSFFKSDSFQNLACSASSRCTSTCSLNFSSTLFV
jgi:hypothetical protein